VLAGVYPGSGMHFQGDSGMYPQQAPMYPRNSVEGNVGHGMQTDYSGGGQPPVAYSNQAFQGVRGPSFPPQMGSNINTQHNAGQGQNGFGVYAPFGQSGLGQAPGMYPQQAVGDTRAFAPAAGYMPQEVYQAYPNGLNMGGTPGSNYGETAGAGIHGQQFPTAMMAGGPDMSWPAGVQGGFRSTGDGMDAQNDGFGGNTFHNTNSGRPFRGRRGSRPSGRGRGNTRGGGRGNIR
jgi:hypothetical protein